MPGLGQLGQLIPAAEIESYWLAVQLGEVFHINGTGTQVGTFNGFSMHRQKRESLAESPFQSPQHLLRKPTAFSSIISMYHTNTAAIFLLEKLL